MYSNFLAVTRLSSLGTETFRYVKDTIKHLEVSYFNIDMIVTSSNLILTSCVVNLPMPYEVEEVVANLVQIKAKSLELTKICSCIIRRIQKAL